MSASISNEKNDNACDKKPDPGGPLPPPPPPPALHILEKRSSLKNNNNTINESHESVIEKLIQKLMDWNSLGGSAGIVISRQVQHIPQVGPKCGIVALNMAMTLFMDREIFDDEILDIARERGYTNHGEMFSAENLKLLATHFMPHVEVQMIYSEDLRDMTFIAKNIAAGNVLLVPYDSSRNFSPECLQGHKAHWAIITGIIIPVHEIFSDSPSHFYKILEPGAEALQEIEIYLPSSGLHVLALQGKSRHLSAWPMLDLAASNENLVQLDPDRESSDLQYIVPEGGLKEGLCGKALLIKCPS